MVTVFTPTYNRANTLPVLFKSLQCQTCNDFEWLIVDDGSNDSTEIIVNEWIKSKQSFSIRYYKVSNGGKMRAINYGAELAKGEIFCGIDSDDWFYDDAISSIIEAFNDIISCPEIIGISFSRNSETPTKTLQTDKLYVDCKNFERGLYGLEADRILVFYTEKMRLYHIPVWEDEKFTPESVFLDQMGLDGYDIRYYIHSIYGGEYLDDGLSASSWRLLRDNPMGYAMMYNVKMLYHRGMIQIAKDVLYFVSCCCIKREYKYIWKSNNRFFAVLLFFPGFLLAKRRKRQFRSYC